MKSVEELQEVVEAALDAIERDGLHVRGIDIRYDRIQDDYDKPARYRRSIVVDLSTLDPR